MPPLEEVLRVIQPEETKDKSTQRAECSARSCCRIRMCSRQSRPRRKSRTPAPRDHSWLPGYVVRLRGNAPGPNGLHDSFWARPSNEWAACVPRASLKEWLLDGVVIFVPKEEASTTADALAADVRPIPLVQTEAKIEAHHANRALAQIAQ